MREPTSCPAPEIGAGVLELLGRFKGNSAFADRYAADRFEKTKAVEPTLKAFYLPVSTPRRPDHCASQMH
jgi:hypothetical protein